MRKSKKTAGILASAIVLTSMFGLSAFADSRHQNETRRGDNDRVRYERHSNRNDDRDLVSGVVQRVDRRRGVVLLHARHGNRSIAVEMVRRRGNRSGVDIGDLRRGDSVTFTGQWGRGGVFEAWRIDEVATRGGRR